MKILMKLQDLEKKPMPQSESTGRRQPRPAVKGLAEFRRVVTGVRQDGSSRSQVNNTKLYCTYPLKLMVPEYASSDPRNSPWLYVISYGGGMVEGDIIGVDVDVGEDCTVVMTTQTTTKVFQSEDGLTTEQRIEGKVGHRGMLAVLPDPLVCFKDARYKQHQVFDLSEEGNIVLLDWVLAGRIARGEIWQMTSCASHNKVSVNGQLVFGDALQIDRESCQQLHGHLSAAMGQFMVFGTCLFFGPKFMEMKLKIQSKVNKYVRNESNGHIQKKEVLASASILDESLGEGVVVKMAASTTELAVSFFADIMEDLFPLIGGNPLVKQ